MLNHHANYSGFTVLHYAVVLDDEAMLSYLLAHGADPTLENGRGLPPASYCTKEEMKARLTEAAEKVDVVFRVWSN